MTVHLQKRSSSVVLASWRLLQINYASYQSVLRSVRYPCFREERTKKDRKLIPAGRFIFLRQKYRLFSSENTIPLIPGRLYWWPSDPRNIGEMVGRPNHRIHTPNPKTKRMLAHIKQGGWNILKCRIRGDYKSPEHSLAPYVTTQ